MVKWGQMCLERDMNSALVAWEPVFEGNIVGVLFDGRFEFCRKDNVERRGERE